MSTTYLNPNWLACVLVSLLFGCTDSQSPPTIDSTSTKKLNVVCTTNIVLDVIRQIGGDQLNATAIMDGPGIDPHTYTPSPKDTNRLTSADVVIYSGLNLEGQLDQAISSLTQRGIPVICLTQTLESDHAEKLIQTETGIADPHVWFHPKLWAICAEHAANELSKVQADSADQFQTNCDQYAKRLIAAESEIQELLSGIPEDRRVLVTAHDAFEYFAEAFRFRVEAVQGISTESEPGLKRINELIELLTEQKISAVFTEQSVSDKNITALIEGCKAKGHEIKIGGRLFSDTIGATDTAEAELVNALLYNARQIAQALKGDDQ